MPSATAADPLGPCTRLEGSQCRAHDPLFGETSNAAVTALPIEVEATRYIVRTTATGPIEVAIEARGTGVIELHRWEESGGAWKVSVDRFQPAAAGAMWSTTFVPAAREQRIAIVSGDGASPFRAQIRPKH